MYDFNTASEQRTGELIPDGTIAPVHLTIRPGSAGDGGWLKRSKSGEGMMLDCEFTVTEGPNAKRKFWGLMMVEGTTEGQQKAADITGSRIRAMLESAYGIRPDDNSPDARSRRQISSWGDLNGLRFMAKIGIEKSEGYKDKNVLAEVITPDRNAWAKVEQVARQSTMQPVGTAAASVAAQANPATSQKPSWAQ